MPAAARRPAPPPTPEPTPQRRAADAAWEAILKGDDAAMELALLALGSAPDARPSPPWLRCRWIGTHLAQKGRADLLIDLADRGWARHLSPPGEHQALDALLAMGAPGAAAFDRIIQGGVELFGPADENANDAAPALLLANAASRGDASALARLRGLIEAEAPHPERMAQTLTRLARDAFEADASAAAVAPWILEEPGAWARAWADHGDSPAKLALESGRAELARAMLGADRGAALSRIDVSQSPLWPGAARAMDLLAEHGADFSSPGSRLRAALHAAIPLHHGPETCAKLLSLGADPRARDAEGSTPIGLAALAWGWPRARRIFDARPSDLLDSEHAAQHASERLPAALHKLREFKGYDGEGWNLADREALRDAFLPLLTAAWEDPRCRTQAFVDMGAEASSARGQPECLRAILELGASEGIAASPRSLAGALLRPASQPGRNAARAECVAMAVEMGVDPGRPFGPGGPDSRDTLIQRAIQTSLDCLLDYPALPKECESLTELACQWTRLGADPSPARLRGQWSFDPALEGRSRMPAQARDAFARIDAALEARILREAFLEHAAPAPHPASKPLRV